MENLRNQMNEFSIKINWRLIKNHSSVNWGSSDIQSPPDPWNQTNQEIPE